VGVLPPGPSGLSRREGISLAPQPVLIMAFAVFAGDGPLSCSPFVMKHFLQQVTEK